MERSTAQRAMVTFSTSTIRSRGWNSQLCNSWSKMSHIVHLNRVDCRVNTAYVVVGRVLKHNSTQQLDSTPLAINNFLSSSLSLSLVSWDRCVISEWPWWTAHFHRSAGGGRLLSERIWSSHLLPGRPRGRIGKMSKRDVDLAFKSLTSWGHPWRDCCIFWLSVTASKPV